MSASELASELQEHLLSVVQIAQEIVVSAVETGAEQAQRVIPDYAERLAAWLRDAAQRARVSNPYLSQVERGLHEPSVRVLAAIAAELDISTETLLARAGL